MFKNKSISTSMFIGCGPKKSNFQILVTESSNKWVQYDICKATTLTYKTWRWYKTSLYYDAQALSNKVLGSTHVYLHNFKAFTHSGAAWRSCDSFCQQLQDLFIMIWANQFIHWSDSGTQLHALLEPIKHPTRIFHFKLLITRFQSYEVVIQN